MYLAGEGAGKWHCADCDERKRNLRNCHNRHDLSWSIALEAAEWRQVPPEVRPVLHGEDFDDLRFYQCPVSCITADTWELLALVDETTNAEGDILHLPCPGTILDQPGVYREAVRIVKSERAAARRRGLKKK